MAAVKTWTMPYDTLPGMQTGKAHISLNASQARPVNLPNVPQTPWVFKTLSIGGWDYEGNPILVVMTLETVKDEQTGKLQGSNVLFDFVDPKNPSKRVAVMTDSLIEVLDEIKAAYTMERLASEGKK